MTGKFRNRKSNVRRQLSVTAAQAKAAGIDVETDLQWIGGPPTDYRLIADTKRNRLKYGLPIGNPNKRLVESQSPECRRWPHQDEVWSDWTPQSESELPILCPMEWSFDRALRLSSRFSEQQPAKVDSKWCFPDAVDDIAAHAAIHWIENPTWSLFRCVQRSARDYWAAELKFRRGDGRTVKKLQSERLPRVDVASATADEQRMIARLQSGERLSTVAIDHCESIHQLYNETLSVHAVKLRLQSLVYHTDNHLSYADLPTDHYRKTVVIHRQYRHKRVDADRVACDLGTDEEHRQWDATEPTFLQQAYQTAMQRDLLSECSRSVDSMRTNLEGPLFRSVR